MKLGRIRRELAKEGLLVPYITLYSWARKGLLGPAFGETSKRGVERRFGDAALPAARVLAQGLLARNKQAGGELLTMRQLRKRLLAEGVDLPPRELRRAVQALGLRVTDDCRVWAHEAIPALKGVVGHDVPEVRP